MVYIQRKCYLLQESLHLAFDIVDQYLSKARVLPCRLQLLGAAALLIASKYEETCPVRVADLARLSGRAYTRGDVIAMEATVLFKIGFCVSHPTSYSFLGRFLFIVDALETTRFAANYYLELAMQDCDLLLHRPSLVALAVVCLAINHPRVREKDGLDNTLPGVVRESLSLCHNASRELSA
jgi:Cyclin, N-terminal domain/Cyclin, C-terminal domain